MHKACESLARGVLGMAVAFALQGCTTQEPIYTAAPVGSKCLQYDVSDIIRSIDTNHDGVMTAAEWQAAGAPPSSFKMISAGRDVATQGAFVATAPPANIDANGDCRITLAEMKAMETRMGGAGGPPGGAGGPPAAGGAPPGGNAPATAPAGNAPGAQ